MILMLSNVNNVVGSPKNHCPSEEFSGSVMSDHFMKLIFDTGAISSYQAQDPVFLEVLDEVTTTCLDNLPSSLKQLRYAQRRLHAQIEELAAEHYPVFLAKAEASESVQQNISNIVSVNENLVSKLPELIDDSKTFLSKAQQINDALQLNSKALDKHTQILELLELPQLMDTCVHNGNYDDAIAILSYTRKVTNKYGSTVSALRVIGSQVEAIGSQLIHHLCSQLRSPISLPACIKVVVFLRRTGVFSEPELRLKFLQARNSCLDLQLISSLNTPRLGDASHKETNELKGGFRNLSNRTTYEAYWRATRRIEATRIQLFDIVTQYRTIFAQENAPLRSNLRSATGASSSHEKAGLTLASPLCSSADIFDDEPQRLVCTLFHAWLIYRVTLFLDAISSDLKQMLHQPAWNVQEVLDRWSLPVTNNAGPATGSGGTDLEDLFTQIQSLISQTMYFGRSFTRVGCDFRPHLVDIFNNSILSFVQVYVDNAITEFTIALEHLMWKMPTSPLDGNTDEADPSLNVNKLLGYPPLVLLYNRFAILYNGLRVCCPIGLRSKLITLVSAGLRNAATRMVSVYRASVDQQTVNWRSEAAAMSDTFSKVLVPMLLDGLLNRLLNDHNDSERTHTEYGVTVQRLRKVICNPMDACFHRLFTIHQENESVVLSHLKAPPVGSPITATQTDTVGH